MLLRIHVVLGVSLLAVALSVAGCSDESKSGGPGAATINSKGDPEDPSNTFELEVPREVNAVQGKEGKATIRIKRGKHFKQRVTLKFDPPTGITVAPDEVTVEPNAKTVDVTVSPSFDAVVGDEAKIRVVAEPETGPAVSVTIKVDVKANAAEKK